MKGKSLAVQESDTQATVSRVKAEIAAIRQRAADEDRAETASERAEIETLLREATNAKSALDRRRSDDALSGAIDALTAGGPIGNIVPGTTSATHRGTSLFAQVERAGFADWHAETRGRRGRQWSSPSFEVPYGALFGATLTSDPASGGALIVPDYRPGIVPLPQRPLVVADLLAIGQTDSNTVTYMVESQFTNAADTVAEGALKPESELEFGVVSDPVRKIAHWLPVTEEMFEDVAQLRSYVDARLRLGVQLTEDDQLLNGTTTAPDIVGIRNRTGLAPDVAQTAPDTAADAIARQIFAIQTTTGLAPDGLVMHPTDWLALSLLKLEDGSYVGSGPFAASVTPTLWGLNVAVTSAMTAGVVLVGCFKSAAQLFRRGGIKVESTNAHQDFFVKNLVAVRAELREALCVYRPGAFGEVNLATVP